MSDQNFGPEVTSLTGLRDRALIGIMAIPFDSSRLCSQLTDRLHPDGRTLPACAARSLDHPVGVLLPHRMRLYWV
jgi:hypothetical protein